MDIGEYTMSINSINSGIRVDFNRHLSDQQKATYSTLERAGMIYGIVPVRYGTNPNARPNVPCFWHNVKGAWLETAYSLRERIEEAGV